MKSKNSNTRPRDATPGDIRYCLYSIEFPDGDVWTDYTHIAGGYNAWIKNTAIWKNNPDVARVLSQKGEAHWKDHNGVTHRMKISETPCERKWGLNKKHVRRTNLYK
jgi:hypothetical protein